jgi:hypothetical protein
MDGIILLLWLAFLVGILGMIWHQRSTIVPYTHNMWLRERRAIQFVPVGAECYGTRPRKYRSQDGVYGALGVVDDTLTFVTRSKLNFAVPLSAIRWVGFRTITVRNGKYTKKVTALIVHAESFDGWNVYSLDSYASYQLAAYLTQRCKLPVHELGTRREDFGPAAATRMKQDVYGQWHGGLRGDLYLAPDWLLFNDYKTIRLEHVQRLGAYERGGMWNDLNPFSEDLLRIDYQEPGGKPHTVGFLVHDADGWAYAIHKASDRPIPIESGRKKKSA